MGTFIKIKQFLFILLLLFAFGEVQAQSKKVYYDLESALQNPESVVKLYLDYQDLTELPPAITRMVNLEELHLGGNAEMNWVQTFQRLAMLPRLVKVNLSENQLITLPRELNGLRALEELFLTGNANLDWESTMEVLAKLPNLKRLDLSSNTATRECFP